MKWFPIKTYTSLHRKAIFVDADGFMFIGEGRQGKGRIEFWDYQDVYEPIYYFYPPPLPGEELKMEKTGRRTNSFDPSIWK